MSHSGEKSPHEEFATPIASSSSSSRDDKIMDMLISLRNDNIAMDKKFSSLQSQFSDIVERVHELEDRKSGTSTPRHDPNVRSLVAPTDEGDKLVEEKVLHAALKQSLEEQKPATVSEGKVHRKASPKEVSTKLATKDEVNEATYHRRASGTFETIGSLRNLGSKARGNSAPFDNNSILLGLSNTPPSGDYSSVQTPHAQVNVTTTIPPFTKKLPKEWNLGDLVSLLENRTHYANCHGVRVPKLVGCLDVGTIEQVKNLANLHSDQKHGAPLGSLSHASFEEVELLDPRQLTALLVETQRPQSYEEYCTKFKEFQKAHTVPFTLKVPCIGSSVACGYIWNC